MKCSHTFGPGGKCGKCGKRKPGRPRGKAQALPSAPPATAPNAAAPSAPVPVGRAERLAILFAPPAPPVPPSDPAANDNAGEEEPKARKPKSSHVGWPLIAKRGSTVVDLVAGAAIDRWTDREPNDCGETELEEFQTALADWGEESLGKVEAPAWIVFLLASVFLVASKYVGAAKKPPKPVEKPTPIPAAKPATPVPALAVDTSIPEGANAATTSETGLTMLTTAESTVEKDAGNADVVGIGF